MNCLSPDFCSEADHVTIGVVNYNGVDVLPETIAALRRLNYPAYDILVVDNGSADGSREWLHRQGEGVRCIFLEENVGAAAARGIVMEKATSDFILFLDNDIRVEADVLTILMNTMKKVPQAGLCHPEIRDLTDSRIFHYNGGCIHYLCALIARNRPPEGMDRPEFEVFDVISGAALLARRELALMVGGFDGDYFFNWEDGDFTARITLAGFQCLNVPSAVVHHRAKGRGTSKVFYQVRNRWYFILKLYHWRTLLLIAPMLLVFEVIQATFLLFKGALGDYCRGTIAAVRDFPKILIKRRRFMKLKRLKDRDWLHAGELFVPMQLDMHSGMFFKLKRVCFSMLNAYWQIVSRLC